MAQPIPYQLDTLGWLRFENLVQELLLAELGLGVEAWGGSADHGVDAFCDSELHFPDRHALNPGPFVFQASSSLLRVFPHLDVFVGDGVSNRFTITRSGVARV